MLCATSKLAECALNAIEPSAIGIDAYAIRDQKIIFPQNHMSLNLITNLGIKTQEVMSGIAVIANAIISKGKFVCGD